MRYTIILAIWIALWTFISNYEPRIEYIEVGTCSELFDEYRKLNWPNKGKDIFNTTTGCNYIQEWKKSMWNNL